MVFPLALITWAVLHSLTASIAFKEIVRGWTGARPYDGLYRLAYNAIAALTIIPVLWLLAAAVPDRILWQVPEPLSYIFLVIQLLGLIGLGISLWQTDIFRFAGLGQALRYLQGNESINRQPTLVTRGSYAYVRHPLYFFSLLLIWFLPIMTLSALLFSSMATLYFWIGSIYEERRLSATFGDAYSQYKQRVPRLIPIKITNLC
jgi:protein-S-isoprenylcysteine O-methyltransferase Ste14